MGFCPQLGGVGPCPAQCIWQGSGFAADQTNAMLAVGGTSCISLVSVAAADENSLTPLHRLLPTETASLGFGGSPVGGGDKSSRFAFFRHFCVGVVSLPSACFACSRNAGRPLVKTAHLPFYEVGWWSLLISAAQNVLDRRSLLMIDFKYQKSIINRPAKKGGTHGRLQTGRC